VTVRQYRKKPVVIEAVQYGGTLESATAVIDWVRAGGGASHLRVDGAVWFVAIDTLEGTMHAAVGDYVIRGVQGEFYPCKPDIFAATYEEVTHP